MKKYTVEELDNICYVSGLSDLSVFYTGGGIYCFIGDLGGLGVSGSSEGNFQVTDTVPTIEQFDDCDWLDAHNVADLTEEEQLNWTYYFLNYFKDAYNEGNEDLVDFGDCNVCISEIDNILANWNTESKQAAEHPEYIVKEEIDVGGPIDALMSYFLNLAHIHQYSNMEENSAPVNATSVCEGLGEIAKRVWENDKTEFFVCVSCDEDFIYWDVETTFQKASLKANIETIYKVVIEEDPYLYIVEPWNRSEIETEYIELSDKTIVFKREYEGDRLCSEELIDWHYGCPKKGDTDYFTKHNGNMKAIF